MIKGALHSRHAAIDSRCSSTQLRLAHQPRYAFAAYMHAFLVEHPLYPRTTVAATTGLEDGFDLPQQPTVG